MNHALQATLILVVGASASAQFEGHVAQQQLTRLVTDGQAEAAFALAFDGGDGLFFTPFDRVDGVGANVGNGQLFTRVPRADLTGPGEWAQHFPARLTGPNEQSCGACHAVPFGDGAGTVAQNVVRDPLRTGLASSFIERQTVHLFASGAIQRLAEEMNEDLQGIRQEAVRVALESGQPATLELSAKGVSFGRITALPGTAGVVLDTSQVIGVDADLVPRPFGWKGDKAFIRDFNRTASHREIGMQPVELVGYGQDGDFDGVVDEMTVGDQTALALYITAQPRPTSEVELARLGLRLPLGEEDLQSIGRGADAFEVAACAECHVPQLLLDDPVYREPSANPNYRDSLFPGGQDPLAEGLNPSFPVLFDLTADQPDNQILDASGNVFFHLGALKTDGQRRAVVELFGDLKRHDMGKELAESVDEIGTGASVWLTENLWGVGSTAPYLHDGRATTLREAIALHGGEAARARRAFLALDPAAQEDLLRFLRNLVIFVDGG